jgi:hypothetical protein
VQAAVAAIEGRYSELLAERMEYMLRCKRIHAAKREDFAMFKAQGIRPKLLRKLCKERELERDIEALRDDLEPDEQSEINMLVDKLGDFANLPLGQAAISRAGNGSGARVTGL